MTTTRPSGMVAAVLLRALLDYGRQAGIDPSGVLGALDVSPTVLVDINGWVPVETMHLAWLIVPEQSRDPDFGLHSGEQTPPGAYGVLEFATISSPTAWDALDKIARYYRLMGAMAELSVIEEGPRVRVRMEPTVKDARLRHFVEHFFALLVSRARLLVRDDFAPLEVRFAHPRPEDTREHTRIFRAPLLFGCSAHELVVAREALEAPLRTANAELSIFLEESSSQVMSKEPDLIARTRTAISRALREGDARLTTVARRMGTSGRTLQRRLAEEGVAYATMLDAVRAEVAARHVVEGRLSLAEIAFILGFAQASTFHRAFKRWTGTTPRSFRDLRRAS